MNSNLYQEQLEKALFQLRKLELDKALVIFYTLLKERPLDLPLIEQIYRLELRKKSSVGFEKIAHHIFKQDSKTDSFNQLFLQAIKDLKRRSSDELNLENLEENQIFNLFYHVAKSTNIEDASKLVSHIKESLSEHQQTPYSLLHYCEQLINKGQLIKAENELEYLLIYYAESNTQIATEKLLKKVRSSRH